MEENDSSCSQTDSSCLNELTDRSCDSHDQMLVSLATVTSTRPLTAPTATKVNDNVNSMITTNNAVISRVSTAPMKNCHGNDQNVRVVARIRPMSDKEMNERSSECLRAVAPSAAIHVITSDSSYTLDGSTTNNKRVFQFDSVFGPEATQAEVYGPTAGDMIQNSIYKGFNATILAYGQTGSGKTFTMGTDGVFSDDERSGSISSRNENEDLLPPSPADGIIARAVYDLFHIRHSLPRGRERVKVEMTYLEIYNEQAIDLLSDDPSSSTLQVRDSKVDGVVIPNLKCFEVSCPGEVHQLMKRAAIKRATGSTLMNSVSSRSHAICTLNVTIAPLDMEINESFAEGNISPMVSTSSRELMRAKLTLVDLAGSERIKRTGAEGARMKEGININKGLFVLGQVVSSLSEIGQMHSSGATRLKTNAHIPYRDSKLTRLLQDSLGGNSRTVMIACISPAESNVEESINTLRYAERTRNIKNSAVRNVVSASLSHDEVAALRRENQLLKLELAHMESKTQICDGKMLLQTEIMTRTVLQGQNIEDVAKLQAQCSSLLAEIDVLKDQLKCNSDAILEASLRADKWQMRYEKVIEVAREKDVDVSMVIDFGDEDGILSHLRHLLHESKTELLEARTEAAIARATAGAIIENKGDPTNLQEAISFSDEAYNDDEDCSQKEHLTKELSEVSGTIEQKEAMLHQILKERTCREQIQVHMENSMQLLQTEVEKLTTEKNSLLEWLHRNPEDKKTNHRNRRPIENPTTKKLRDQIMHLEERINELKHKSHEHAKSLKMKEEAEKKCSRLMAEINEDKKHRANLQKKLKEISTDMRNEKKAAQQKAARLIKDRQKLTIELAKIKSMAEKQAIVLKRKIDEMSVKVKKQKSCIKNPTLSSSNNDIKMVQDRKKQDLEAWIDSEIEYFLICRQIDERKRELDSALGERKKMLLDNSNNSDASQLDQIDEACKTLRAIIENLESTSREAFPLFQTNDNLYGISDSKKLNSLSNQEVNYVLSYMLQVYYSLREEADKLVFEHDTKTKLAVDSAIIKEKQIHEKELVNLKMEHGESTINLLESTQRTLNSNIMQMIASSCHDQSIKANLENMLQTYMQSCQSTGQDFKLHLNKMKESEGEIQKMIEDVAKVVSFVKAPATAKKQKKPVEYESDIEEELDESFEVEVDNSSDYEPTPTPRKQGKRNRATKKTELIHSPLMGEDIPDEETLVSMTLQGLRQVCKKNNLSMTGKKADLQNRIKAKIHLQASPKSTCRKVMFKEHCANIDEASVCHQVKPDEGNLSLSESLKKQLWQGTDNESSDRLSLLNTPSTSHSSVENLQNSAQNDHSLLLTNLSKLSKSPKRKRSSGDLCEGERMIGFTPKKIKPLGFMTSSPRLLSPPHVAPLSNYNRSPIMIKNQNFIDKKCLGYDITEKLVGGAITASAKKRTKRGMNAAVARALKHCDGNF